MEKLKLIALEEHYAIPELFDYPPEFLKSFQTMDARLEAMDANGIDMEVLSTAQGPLFKADKDAARDAASARKANDILAEVCARHPTRFASLAHLALQDPEEAARELERAVKQLGMKGALIKGAAGGGYLDEQRMAPLWERAEALDVPLYLHPGNAVEHWAMVDDYPELETATWRWGVETATHALRVILSGVFDRYPKATMILGHMGEMLPFTLWRLDTKWAAKRNKKPLKKMPSDYLRENVHITTSGVPSGAPLICSMLALGADRIMFAVDVPYEQREPFIEFIRTVPISEDDRHKIAHGNAERLLRL